MNRERLIQSIKDAEGFSSQKYWDISQFSGGFGHRLPSTWGDNTPINEAQATAWLEADLDIAIKDTISIFIGFDKIDDIRQEALVEMCYNIGKPRLQGFRKMIAAVNACNWDKAALEAKNSKWFHQTGNRAKRIVWMIGTGTILT